jgi:hypothetical protein
MNIRKQPRSLWTAYSSIEVAEKLAARGVFVSHRELVYRRVEFHKRGQLFINPRNVTLTITVMRVSDLDWAASMIWYRQFESYRVIFARISTNRSRKA